MKNIFAISGSTRKDSTNWIILKTIKELFKDKLNVEIYDELDKLPHFNPNLVNDEYPKTVRNLISKIDIAEGVIICTPEYVFSLPAILKNALEWTVSETVFSYKPTALIVAASLGEKIFETLDLIVKTLLQEAIPKYY
ncbi:MAG: NAD(P)H-dependent oxidoreductase [Melioribacteraceae bacterium]